MLLYLNINIQNIISNYYVYYSLIIKLDEDKKRKRWTRKKPSKEREGDTIVRFLLLEPKGRKTKGRRISDSSSYNLVLCLSK